MSEKKISKARALIQTVLHRFYYVHHNKETFETELVDEVQQSRVRAFSETKHRVLSALDYRLNRLNESLEVLRKKPDGVQLTIDDMQSRVCELESFRKYVKGIVVKVDE